MVSDVKNKFQPAELQQCSEKKNGQASGPLN